MLYDFHQKQNARNPKSVHATYVIAGRRRVEVPNHTNGTVSQDDDDGDSFMQSSPFPSSLPEKPGLEETTQQVRTITIVTEEELDGPSNHNVIYV